MRELVGAMFHRLPGIEFFIEIEVVGKCENFKPGDWVVGSAAHSMRKMNGARRNLLL